jgi:hypothetical protein
MAYHDLSKRTPTPRGHTAATHHLMRHFENEWIAGSHFHDAHHIAREVNVQHGMSPIHAFHRHEIDSYNLQKYNSHFRDANSITTAFKKHVFEKLSAMKLAKKYNPAEEGSSLAYSHAHGLSPKQEQDLVSDTVRRQSKISAAKWDKSPYRNRPLYRGVHANEIRHPIKGDLLHFRPLMSTTPNKNIAENFGEEQSNYRNVKHMIELHGVEGKHTFAGFHTSHEHFNNEKEVILKGASTSWKVAAKHEVPNYEHIFFVKKGLGYRFTGPTGIKCYNYHPGAHLYVSSPHDDPRKALEHERILRRNRGQPLGAEFRRSNEKHLEHFKTTKTPSSVHLIVHPSGTDPASIPSLQARLQGIARETEKFSKVATKIK